MRSPTCTHCFQARKLFYHSSLALGHRLHILSFPIELNITSACCDRTLADPSPSSHNVGTEQDALNSLALLYSTTTSNVFTCYHVDFIFLRVGIEHGVPMMMSFDRSRPQQQPNGLTARLEDHHTLISRSTPVWRMPLVPRQLVAHASIFSNIGLLSLDRVTEFVMSDDWLITKSGTFANVE